MNEQTELLCNSLTQSWGGRSQLSGDAGTASGSQESTNLSKLMMRKHIDRVTKEVQRGVRNVDLNIWDMQLKFTNVK